MNTPVSIPHNLPWEAKRFIRLALYKTMIPPIATKMDGINPTDVRIQTKAFAIGLPLREKRLMDPAVRFDLAIIEEPSRLVHDVKFCDERRNEAFVECLIHELK